MATSFQDILRQQYDMYEQQKMNQEQRNSDMSGFGKNVGKGLSNYLRSGSSGTLGNIAGTAAGSAGGAGFGLGQPLVTGAGIGGAAPALSGSAGTGFGLGQALTSGGAGAALPTAAGAGAGGAGFGLGQALTAGGASAALPTAAAGAGAGAGLAAMAGPVGLAAAGLYGLSKTGFGKDLWRETKKGIKDIFSIF